MVAVVSRADWVRPRNRLRCSLRNRTTSGTIRGEVMKTFWVYIMSNKSRRLYVGMTSTLVKRVFQHKNKLYPESFTARYQFDMTGLV